MADLATLVRGPRRLGLVICALVLAGGAVFASLAPVSSAALAPGVISHDGDRKLVQHQNGGTIARIHVREGDRVRTGDALVTMDDTPMRAAANARIGDYVHLRAARARLIAAERGDGVMPDPPSFRANLAFRAPQPWIEEALAVQSALLVGRDKVQRSRATILDRRARELADENEVLAIAVAALTDQIRYTREEAATVAGLLERGLERRPRLLALQREAARVQAQRAETEARIARNRQAIGEARAERHALDLEARDERNAERADVEARLAGVTAELPALLRELDNAVVRAPVDGTVLDLRIKTEGGVVAQGDVLMAISPVGAPLLIDARVRPTDVEGLHAGLAAKVVFTGLANRHLPELHGVVRSISPDRLEDERSGAPYFLARIEITEAIAALEREGLRLSAGMPADTFILLGEATLLGYLSEPLTHSLRRAFTGP